MNPIASGVYNSIPKWIMIWLILSMLIVSWDVLFVLLRPVSFTVALWQPYAKYILIDKSYADLNNSFVVTQAIMSLVEIMIGLIGIFYYLTKRGKVASLLIFSSQLLTLAKTILIFFLEIIGGFPYTGHNHLNDLILYYYLPNSVWIILPLIVIMLL